MSSPRVLISDAMSPRAAALLAQAGLGVDLRSELPGAPSIDQVIPHYEAVLLRSSTTLGPDQLARAERLQVIGRAGIGVDNVDLGAASARGVVVMNTPLGNATTTAEHAIAMMLAVSRNIPQATAAMRAGRWDKKRYKGREVTGKVLGIVGLGNIGRIVASRAQGLRMRVIAFDPFLTEESAARIDVRKVSYSELLQQSDYISIHTPLNEQTRNLFDAEALGQMKPGSFLICCARGGIVDEAALVAALDEGPLGGAALDVFSTEPPRADHPLRAHPKAVLTPHLGASTSEAQEAVAVQIAEQVIAFFRDGTLANAVNAWTLSGDRRRVLEPYLSLATRIGSLAGQVHTGEVQEVSIRFRGGPSEEEQIPLTAHLLAALLQPRLGPEVNPISARSIARERGIALTTGTTEESAEFGNMMELRLRGSGRDTKVSGVVFGKRGNRVVSLDGYTMDFDPAGEVLLIRNEDRPGIIGAVGQILGKHSINVSRLVVGARDGAASIALWSTDQRVSEEVLDAVASTSGIRAAMRLTLPA